MEIRTSTLAGIGPLPLVAEPQDQARNSTADLIRFIKENSAWLSDQLNQAGGVLFRGYVVREVDEFQSISQAVIPQLAPYIEGQSPRTKVGDNIYTSTEFPAQYRITLHNELSYVKSAPERIIFHCNVQPIDRGETPIVDCRKIYRLLEPSIRDRFEKLGVKYVKNMHGQQRGMGKSWMDHFESNDRNVVEKHLHENDIEFEWAANNGLRTWVIRPGVRKHPVTGESYWFNQSNLWHSSNLDEKHRRQMLDRFGEDNLPTHAYFGDGSPIDDEIMNGVRELLWNESAIFPWAQGDVLVLNNHLVGHGRNAYSGPRKILVAMG